MSDGPDIRAGRLRPAEIEANFSDINPPLNAHQAAVEAARCRFCHDAPCTEACPTEIDIPGFIRKISTGNTRASNYESCKKGYKDDGFFTGCLTVRRAKAQQKAACTTSKATADNIVTTAMRQGFGLVEYRKQYRCALIKASSLCLRQVIGNNGKVRCLGCHIGVSELKSL